MSNARILIPFSLPTVVYAIVMCLVCNKLELLNFVLIT